MNVAINCKGITELLTLNSKGERIILKLPKSEWVIIESVTNPGMILNKEAIIESGGQIYYSEWRSTPPFGDKSVSFIRNGFNTVVKSTFSEIKRVSNDSALELSTESKNTYDTIIQDTRINEYINSVNKITESLTNKVAGLKYELKHKIKNEDEFNSVISSEYATYFENLKTYSDSYLLDVFEVRINYALDSNQGVDAGFSSGVDAGSVEGI